MKESKILSFLNIEKNGVYIFLRMQTKLNLYLETESLGDLYMSKELLT